MAKRYVDGRGLVNEVLCSRSAYCEFAEIVNKCKHSILHIPCGCEKLDVCDMSDTYCLCEEIKEKKEEGAK